MFDWKEAEEHLKYLIKEYSEIGLAGKFALNLTLNPLLKRFETGERTESLYNEIMECE